MDLGGWPRYLRRDLPSAWQAIDDLRTVLGTPATIAAWRARLEQLEKVIDQMEDADQVSQAVARARTREWQLGLTLAQKLLAGGVGFVYVLGALAAIALAVRELVG